MNALNHDAMIRSRVIADLHAMPADLAIDLCLMHLADRLPGGDLRLLMINARDFHNAEQDARTEDAEDAEEAARFLWDAACDIHKRAICAAE